MKTTYRTSNATPLGKVALVLLLFLLTVLAVAPVAAQEPGVEQPTFTENSYVSPDGKSQVHTQETTLDSAYFGASGSLEGLEISESGLQLTVGQESGVYTSEPIDSPLQTATDIAPLWKIDLPSGSKATLETRLSLDGSAWSDWLPNPEVFYPVRDNQHAGSMIWAAGQEASLQFRFTLTRAPAGESPTLRSLTLFFSDVSDGPSDVEIAANMTVNSQATNVCPIVKPNIISRVGWGSPDGQNSPRRPATYAPVTHIIIHQAETPNSTAPYQDWAGWTRSIWNYHANVLGWGDVGYNYMIDPAGNIYEGRAGGNDVVGIHDTHNEGSMAIGFLGCYGNCDDPRLSVAQPSQAMLESAKALMSWKLEQKGIDPLSSATYDNLVNIPVIAGGRDVVNTTSPGDNLYNKLPELRTAASQRIDDCARQACVVQDIIFNQTQYAVGETIYARVKVVDQHGNPVSGANVNVDVSKQAASAGVSAAGFGLIDLSGLYEGSYSYTDTPGRYTFKASVTHPNFLPCTLERSTTVVSSAPTPTPPTPTPPTPTPPTPTPPTPTPPQGVIVKVDPESVQAPDCGQQGQLAIAVQNVSDLQSFELEISYNPAIVEIVDSDPLLDGIQVKPGDVFGGDARLIVVNSVDPAQGLIKFSAAVYNSVIQGNANLIYIEWLPKNQGTSAITLNKSDLYKAIGNNQTEKITHGTINGQIAVSSNCSSALSGAASLQGRSDYSGIRVVNGAGQEIQTGSDGSFNIADGASVVISYPGYLSAASQSAAAVSSAANAASLGNITLLGGDVNQDNIINIFDLAYMAQQYGGNDSLADLNNDNTVNINDLALAAGNYNRAGPLTNWRAK